MDDKGISTIDPGGIALAAIKELQKINEQQNELIQQLLKRLEMVEKISFKSSEKKAGIHEQIW